MTSRSLRNAIPFPWVWISIVAGCGAAETVADADDGDEDAETGEPDRTPGETTDASDAETPPCACADDTDCDDLDPCNGRERCVACACLPGSSPPDGTPCNDGNACTTGDACLDGACVGTPRDCDDGNPCTDDACDTATGCAHLPNTAPCDDGDPCTGPDACADRLCAGERLPDWYPDLDGDTFGDRAAAPVCAASPPARRTADHSDCCDADDDVHPGQTAWFVESYTCAGASTASWDYDCSGAEELRYTDVGGGCSRSGASCIETLGWVGLTARTCGSGGSYVTGCDAECRPIQESTAQECR